jgi:hypothetical protein
MTGGMEAIINTNAASIEVGECIRTTRSSHLSVNLMMGYPDHFHPRTIRAEGRSGGGRGSRSPARDEGF